MRKLSSKNDNSSLCHDVIITHQNFKIDKFSDFSCDTYITVGQMYLEILSPL